MTIRSMPTNQAYRDGWDRTFGGKNERTDTTPDTRSDGCGGSDCCASKSVEATCEATPEKPVSP